MFYLRRNKSDNNYSAQAAITSGGESFEAKMSPGNASGGVDDQISASNGGVDIESIIQEKHGMYAYPYRVQSGSCSGFNMTSVIHFLIICCCCCCC